MEKLMRIFNPMIYSNSFFENNKSYPVIEKFLWILVGIAALVTIAMAVLVIFSDIIKKR